MVGEERITSLCEAFLRSGLKIKWKCNGRLNFAKPKILKLMKKSGCVFIHYGIESLDDEVLRIMGKGLTVAQITQGIKATLDASISPGFNIIFGHIGDTQKTLSKAVDFLLRYDDGGQRRTIRPVTPYPGSELYRKAIEMGRLMDCQDFYENKHVNSELLTVNFTNLSDDEFHLALMNANRTLLNNYNCRLQFKTDNNLKHLYMNKDVTFRGFRTT